MQSAYTTHTLPRDRDADVELIDRVARLLDEQGHPQATAVLRSATGLMWPALRGRFGGRWTIWVDTADLPEQRYDIAQQIKRALNAISGVDASYADLRDHLADH